MKTKLLGFLVASALSLGSAHGVSLATSFIANNTTNIGLITTTASGSLANASGSLWIYSSSTNLTSIASSVTTRSAFEALLVLDPGAVRSNVSFTNGAVTSSGSVELGAVGNSVYVWIQSSDANSFGAYKRSATVPALGSIVMNSVAMNDLGVGTSVYSATGTSGFQLAFVPEPSAALLGMLGALGLLRRRR
jgi:hypothetical protein